MSGVRSSWLTVETNSVFIWSMRLRSVMSETITMKPSGVPSRWLRGLPLISTQKVDAPFRYASSSTVKGRRSAMAAKIACSVCGVGQRAMEEVAGSLADEVVGFVAGHPR